MGEEPEAEAVDTEETEERREALGAEEPGTEEPGTEEDSEEGLDEEEVLEEGYEDDQDDRYEEDDGVADDDEEDEEDLGITKETVADATNDFNAIYKEGAAAARELKGAFDDIKSAFSFGDLFK